MTLILYYTSDSHEYEDVIDYCANSPNCRESSFAFGPSSGINTFRKDLFVMGLLKHCVIHIGGLQLDLWIRVLEVEELYW